MLRETYFQELKSVPVLITSVRGYGIHVIVADLRQIISTDGRG